MSATRDPLLDLSSLVDSVPNMVFVNCRGRLVYVNARCSEVMGYSREELLDADFDFRSLVATDDWPKISAAFARHQERQEVAPYEYVAVTRDGQRLDVIQATRLVSYGDTWAILGVITDITARKHLERELARSEARYRSLVETCPDAIVLLDADLKILMTNRQGARLLGHDEPEAIIGRDAIDFIASDDHPRAMADLHRTLASGAIRNLAYVLLRKDGERVPAELSASVVRGSPDEPTRLIMVIRDVTSQQRLLQAKRQLTSKVIAAQEEERRHVARELHDGVGQMLIVLGMEADWLAGHTQHPEVAGRAAELQRKTQQTLEMVREMSHGLRPSVLDDLGISCALESLAAQATAHLPLRCEVSVDDDLDDLPADIATAIYRVAQEALANVLRHASADRTSVVLEDEDTITLTVEDNGRGFSLEALDTTATLGIAHMRERAELLGGELRIEAREPTGTRLIARFPRLP